MNSGEIIFGSKNNLLKMTKKKVIALIEDHNIENIDTTKTSTEIKEQLINMFFNNVVENVENVEPQEMSEDFEIQFIDHKPQTNTSNDNETHTRTTPGNTKTELSADERRRRRLLGFNC